MKVEIYTKNSITCLPVAIIDTDNDYKKRYSIEDYRLAEQKGKLAKIWYKSGNEFKELTFVGKLTSVIPF